MQPGCPDHRAGAGSVSENAREADEVPLWRDCGLYPGGNGESMERFKRV